MSRVPRLRRAAGRTALRLLAQATSAYYFQVCDLLFSGMRLLPGAVFHKQMSEEGCNLLDQEIMQVDMQRDEMNSTKGCCLQR
jgi:hypothetical protein